MASRKKPSPAVWELRLNMGIGVYKQHHLEVMSTKMLRVLHNEARRLFNRILDTGDRSYGDAGTDYYELLAGATEELIDKRRRKKVTR